MAFSPLRPVVFTTACARECDARPAGDGGGRIAAVDHGAHRNALGHQIRRRAPAIVIVGEHRHLVPGVTPKRFT
jgi:hypothetical protein